MNKEQSTRVCGLILKNSLVPALLCIVFLLTSALGAVRSGEKRELYRIRVVNAGGGPVEVSIDSGKSYARVGRVIEPATSTIEGFAASVYSPSGVVAATAVHGVRLKVAGAAGCRLCNTQVISIIPREFRSSPNGFGGHTEGKAGIYTDIPTGKAIFRNLAPFVGNPVLIERLGRLIPLPDGYVPGFGDVLVIVVEIPSKYPKEITFENREGGAVTAVYPSGKETFGRVEQPVTGIGRFDATGYTGVGHINTNHIGVITVSTAPIVEGQKDGGSVETRGGFMIQPSHHAGNVPHGGEVMVVGPTSPSGKWLEGTPPLFSGYLGLDCDEVHAEHSFRVEVKTTISDWVQLPVMVGKCDDELLHLPNHLGRVTDIRIRFPDLSKSWLAGELRTAENEYRTERRAEAVRNGWMTRERLEYYADVSKLQSVSYVSLYVDGEFAGVSNCAPFSFLVDSGHLASGDHAAVMQAVTTGGERVSCGFKRFFVQ